MHRHAPWHEHATALVLPHASNDTQYSSVVTSDTKRRVQSFAASGGTVVGIGRGALAASELCGQPAGSWVADCAGHDVCIKFSSTSSSGRDSASLHCDDGVVLPGSSHGGAVVATYGSSGSTSGVLDAQPAVSVLPCGKDGGTHKIAFPPTSMGVCVATRQPECVCVCVLGVHSRPACADWA